MAVDVMATLRKALEQLEDEKKRVESQMTAIMHVLNGAGAIRGQASTLSVSEGATAAHDRC